MKITKETIETRNVHKDVRNKEGHVNVCVVGSRNFNDYEILSSVLCSFSSKSKLIKNASKIKFLCGGARGADSLGEVWAKKNNYETESFIPDWGANPNTAGFIRNVQMATLTDVLIAFWDGESRGTKHMLKTCHSFNIMNGDDYLDIFLYRTNGEFWWSSVN